MHIQGKAGSTRGMHVESERGQQQKVVDPQTFRKRSLPQPQHREQQYSKPWQSLRRFERFLSERVFLLFNTKSYK